MNKSASATLLTTFIAALCAIGFLTQSASALTIRNTSLEFANHGMCSAAFDLEGGLDELADVRIYYQALNEDKEVVDSGVFLIDSFGNNTASRFERVYLENEPLCYERLVLRISKATAVIDGEIVDLLRTGDLQLKEFVPMTIIIAPN